LKRLLFVSHGVTEYLEHDHSSAMVHESLIDSSTLRCCNANAAMRVTIAAMRAQKREIAAAWCELILNERSPFRIAGCQKGLIYGDV
jgi:hypothetical protein